MTVRRVPAPPGHTVSITAPLTHRCPFVDEVDEGTVTISWMTGSSTFELHELRGYLDQFRKVPPISHEWLTDRIHADLSAGTGLEVVSVTTRWQTAGMEVTCSTSPTPAAAPASRPWPPASSD